eukprot:TRINITY_DN4516_c0_g1_i6.p1 TRINITY_DN4516_c0_g1~~TRINITY_DN4516_c0_g1_i6.p1  ORF type:complete len:566 (+),score=87.99 TRINITY_DN4516_c0_g1_i6:3-1700(+)
MEKKTKPKGEKLAKEKGESLSRSKRAGLTFPVARLHRHLRGSSGINAEYGSECWSMYSPLFLTGRRSLLVCSKFRPQIINATIPLTGFTRITRVSSFQPTVRVERYSSSRVVPVDQVLKKFFKLVHPDLCTDPTKKLTNQMSFALLMDYLDLVKDNNRKLGQESKPFTLKFFLSGGTDCATLDVVPPRFDSPQREKSKHLSITLSKLFTKCNFAHDPFDVSGYGVRAVEEHYARPGEFTLSQFLIQTVGKRKISKHVQKEKEDMEVKVSNHMKGLLNDTAKKFGISKFGFNVREHLFQGVLERNSSRILLLEKVGIALDEVMQSGKPISDFNGAVIIFSTKESGIDVNRQLLLNYNCDYKEWLPSLENYSPSRIDVHVAKLSARMQLEQRITELLNISSFTSNAKLSGNLVYRSLLGNLVGSLEKNPWKFSTNIKNLKIRVDDVPLPAVDIVGPTLIVPFTVTPNILQDIIEANANNIMEEHKLLRDSVSFVRQELGLQELHYLSPPELLEEHLVECINRLYKHIGILKPYTPGLRLLIANDYGYNIESQTVSIRWDYCVERNQS